MNHLPRGLKPSGFWSVYAGLKARSSTVLEPVARCWTYRMVPRTVLDVSHGAGQQASRALYLAALTARLKPCPSTTVPIPAFLRNLLSRAFPENIYEVLFPC